MFHTIVEEIYTKQGTINLNVQPRRLSKIVLTTSKGNPSGAVVEGHRQ